MKSFLNGTPALFSRMSCLDFIPVIINLRLAHKKLPEVDWGSSSQSPKLIWLIGVI